MPDKVIATVYVYSDDRVLAYAIAGKISFALREISNKTTYPEMSTAEQVMPKTCRVKVTLRVDEEMEEDLPF